ncbi:DUF2933 domain-containing protein [Nocardia beijingensis]|uniref:hypothetical protein n=1 Tax=Nocardia beijingensis TaxID=95162 RepID=UPI0018940104|nr:hypothetical protein [Nocardia beijingensis]MBF6079356.1 hypothetical protein [Nocardia beijingensis]
MNLRQAPLYVLALTVLVTALVLSGLPAFSLLLLQVVLACPLLLLVLTGGDSYGRRALKCAARSDAQAH